MDIKEFAKKYLNIILSDHHINVLYHIKDMKNPIIIHSRHGFLMIDEENKQCA